MYKENNSSPYVDPLYYIHRMGKAHEKLSQMLSKFDDLEDRSKHNEWWQSEDEVVDEKLQKLRWFVISIQEELYEVMEHINIEKDE